MNRVIATGGAPGARIEGIDLSRPVADAEVALIRDALGVHDVPCFPGQDLAPDRHKAFARHFGSLEVNVAAGRFAAPGHPEVMILNLISAARNLLETSKRP